MSRSREAPTPSWIEPLLRLAEKTRQSVLLVSPQGRILYANPAAAAATGYARDEFSGLEFSALFPPGAFPDLLERLAEAERHGANVETSIRRKDGSEFTGDVGTERDAEGILVVIFHDITRRKRGESVRQIATEIGLRLLRGEEIDAILAAVVERVCAAFGCALVWIGLKERDGSVRVAARYGPETSYLDGIQVRWDDSPLAAGPVGRAIRTAQPQVFEVEDPPFTPWRDRARAHGLAGVMSVPLIRHGEVLGSIVIYHRQSRMGDESCLADLGSLAGLVAQAVAEAEHQEQIRLKTAALDAAANAMVLTDREGVIEWINPAFTALTGYAPEEVIGKTPGVLKSGRHDAAFYADLWRTITAGRVWRGEIHNRRKDGSVYVEEMTITPVRDREGAVRHFIAIKEDVTLRRRDEEARAKAEAELRESEARFRALLENSPVGICIVRAGVIRYVNRAYAWLFGCESPEELVGTSFLQQVAPAARAEVAERSLQREMGLPAPTTYELPGLHRDGSTLPIRVAVARMDLPDGPASVAFCIDVSETKRAEEALRSANDRLRALIEASPVGIIALDKSGHVELINRAAERILALGGAALASRRLPLELVDEWPVLRSILDRVLGGERVSGVDFEWQPPGRSAPVSLNVSAAPLHDAAGVVRGFMVIAVDVAAHRQLERQLLLSQKLEGIGRLAGGVAHDFNNLLTVILTSIEFLLGALGEHDPRREDAQQVRHAAERAASLTRQLLAFSRRQVMQPRLLNLNEVLADLEKMLRRLIGEDIDLEVEAAPGLWTVRADPAQLEQVIVNLVVNARDAMPTGGKLILRTSNLATPGAGPLPPGEYTMLTVTDTGEGMDCDTKARCFEPFFSTKGAGKGTGLGLSTVHGIVNQSGGHIFVDSAPGQGTTFRIYLPRAGAAEIAVAPEIPEARAFRGTETILLVEDEDLVRGLARRVLQEQGYRLLVASHGEEALALSQEHAGAIDLLVSDVVMPRMSGPELAGKLARAYPQMKVLYISGYTGDALTTRGVVDPGLEILFKPFTRDALARRVRDVLDGRGRAGQIPGGWSATP